MLPGLLQSSWEGLGGGLGWWQCFCPRKWSLKFKDFLLDNVLLKVKKPSASSWENLYSVVNDCSQVTHLSHLFNLKDRERLTQLLLLLSLCDYCMSLCFRNLAWE